MIKSLEELKPIVNERFSKELKDADESDILGFMLRIFADELKKNLPDDLVEDEDNKEIWEQLWELYLANYLLENGLPIDRKRGDSQPDFFFKTKDGKKVNIEATVANDATEKDLKVFGNNSDIDDDSLDSWIVHENKGILRLTNSISGKEKQYHERYEAGTISSDDFNVLAINGAFVVHPAFSQMGNNIEPNMRFGFLMHCACYGLTGQAGYRTDFNNHNEYCFYNGSIKKREEKMPPEVNNCFNNKDFPFDGILYSQNMECYTPPKFIYFQNPNGKDLTEFLKFCEIRTKDSDVFFNFKNL